MSCLSRWLLGLTLAALIVGIPVVYHRYTYTHSKRLREVAPGVLYRSGQMSAEGFADAIARLGIRTVINLQNEYPDPDLIRSWFDRRTIKESELCRRLGVQYVFVPAELIPRRQVPAQRPAAIDRFLALLDDPANHPVLIHCKAGLHRTGLLAAVYRMEYQGWSAARALRDVKANGFGEFACNSANDYVTQYVLTYRPRKSGQWPVVSGQQSGIPDH